MFDSDPVQSPSRQVRKVHNYVLLPAFRFGAGQGGPALCNWDEPSRASGANVSFPWSKMKCSLDKSSQWFLYVTGERERKMYGQVDVHIIAASSRF